MSRIKIINARPELPEELNADLNDLLNEIERGGFECAAGPLDMHPAWQRVRLWCYFNEIHRGRMTAKDVKADEERRRTYLSSLPPTESPT